MKKIILYFSVIALALTSCRKDDTTTVTETVDITTQNSYDDQAIQKYLTDHYFDSKGNVKEFSSTDPTDDNYPKLSSYSPVTLPSGVVYIVRTTAQPTSGTAIASNDLINIMQNTYTYIATKDSSTGTVSFTSGFPFENTIAGTGIPTLDPKYYYVRSSFLAKYNKDNSTSKDRSYFEIEGFKEALMKFTAFNISNSENYNLQGVILVPSRAAFARDASYWGTTTDRSFIFNFQIYSTSPRITDDKNPNYND